ncbi:MAG: hypothetical protein HKN28_08370 [Alphaproteobacteria bacterium]|nr:hypothetical protein [Alphaproteobacteria bacterium]
MEVKSVSRSQWLSRDYSPDGVDVRATGGGSSEPPLSFVGVATMSVVGHWQSRTATATHDCSTPTPDVIAVKADIGNRTSPAHNNPEDGKANNRRLPDQGLQECDFRIELVIDEGENGVF